MHRPHLRALIGLLTLTATLAGCSPSPSASQAPPAAAPPLTTGLDRASFEAAVRPQDDIYRHVNGGWLDRTSIPDDRAAYGGFYEAIDRTQARLRAIAERAAGSDGKAATPELRKIGDFYTAFMDEARTDTLGRQPLAPELERIASLSTKADLARQFAHMAMINAVAVVLPYVDGDAKDPSVNTAYLVQGGLGLPDRDYYLKDEPRLKEYRSQYRAYIERTLTLAGYPDAARHAADIVALETRIARAHWTNVESRDAVKTYNRISTADLPREFPGFDWSAWSAELGTTALTALVVAQPSYVRTVAALVAERPVDQWKPYLAFHLVHTLGPFLSRDFVEARFDFMGRTLQGIKQQKPRWKRALDALESTLGEALGKAYVEAHFTPEAKARMETMVEQLRGAFREGIDQLDWMGPATRAEAQAKLAAFRPKIGYPGKWRDYSAVDIRRDDLVGNILRAWMADSRYQLAKAGRPVDPEDWGMTPQTVNAYYNPVRNEIVFPAAILQPPFFDMAADDAVNYGGIGAVIGHEMGHGFDDQGRRYDARGQLRDWWTEEDARRFSERAQGLVSQYAAVEPLAGVKVNGELTLGENIGDLTGVTIAYRAYTRSLQGRAAPDMDGMPAARRFFFGWVQAWRGKYRDDALRMQLMANPHAPDAVRGRLPLVNVTAFHDAFGTKEGDGMWLAPERRIRIW